MASLSYTSASTLHAASPTPKSHLHHCRMALLLYILYLGIKTPSHSPSCTTVNSQVSHTQAISACSRQSAENNNDLTANHFAQLRVSTACFYNYTSQTSPPLSRSSCLSLLACCYCHCYPFSSRTTTAWIKHTSCFSEHLKTTTTTTTSNFRRSLLLPSLPAAMRSLSFMVASLFVSALTLSSASNKVSFQRTHTL